jgi:predicted Zn-dependent protease
MTIPSIRFGACRLAGYNTLEMTAPQAGTNRRQMLERFVEKNPTDPFARYGLAMECVKEGDIAAAETQFKQLLNNHADYVATYYQFGRMLTLANRVSEAREIFSAGIARAMQAGEEHARQELQAALDELS